MRKLVSIYSISVIVIAGLSSLLFTSCSKIHDFPDDNPVDPTLVSVNIESILSYQFEGTEGFSSIRDEAYAWRFVIEIYKLGDDSKPVLRKEITQYSLSTDVSNKEKLMLHAAKYRVVIWGDLVPIDNTIDTYYSTSKGLRQISLINPMVANNHNLDCFYGFKDIDLTPYINRWDAEVTFPIQLSRPVAKYILITNDIDKFISRAINRGKSVSRTILTEYTLKIYHKGFEPNGFDAFTGRLDGAQQGFWYSSSLIFISEKEAIISFAYPLTNGPSSRSIVDIEVYDSDGVLINEVQDVTIPITRGKETIIRSDFLTRTSSSGIKVDQNYDGEINVNLPD